MQFTFSYHGSVLGVLLKEAAAAAWLFPLLAGGWMQKLDRKEKNE